MPINAIILAAGEGTRMKSAHPKVTHKLLEKPLIWWPVHAAREAGCERIIVSAAKQSHKGAVPSLAPLTPVREFLERDFAPGVRKFICYCSEVEGASKIHIREALVAAGSREFVVMIGPEGDFSREEMALAVECGWQIISLGDSRLRIETAALAATAAVYLNC